MKYKLIVPKVKKLHYDINVPVFDITVFGDHSYTVGKNKIIVHNCRTYQNTGFRTSTVSALERCANAAKSIDIMSDGGLTVNEYDEVSVGDVAKAIRFGADFVMSGALFARCSDSIAAKNGYYGNASETAKKNKRHIEGTHLMVQSSGLTISQTCDWIEDSLRSSVSYAGGTTLNALRYVNYEIIHPS